MGSRELTINRDLRAVAAQDGQKLRLIFLSPRETAIGPFFFSPAEAIKIGGDIVNNGTHPQIPLEFADHAEAASFGYWMIRAVADLF